MYKELKILIILMVAAIAVNCGKPLPIEEMSTAKLEISKAESYKAARFAPEELEAAKKAMYASHDYAADEKVSETKVEAEKATASARNAILKALPLLTMEAKENAGKAIGEADRSFAIQLAADDFNKAVELVKEGDAKSAEASGTMTSFQTDKKPETRQAGVDQYEVALKNYRDAEEYANRAATLAMSQKQQIIDSSADIEESINRAEKYGADTEQAAALRKRYSDAIAAVQDGRIKEGFENLDGVRKDANLLVAGSIKDYADKRKALAKEKLTASDASLAQAAKNKAADKTKSVEEARTQLNAGKEALTSAEDLFSQEQYEKSVEQSDEAIRLADIVLERSGMLVASARKGGGTAAVKTDGKSAEEIGDQEGVWKTYTVKKKKPADCLWRIAGLKEHYNNPRLWKRIYKANKGKIKNPNRIYPKQVLNIPYPPGQKKEEKAVEDKPEAAVEERPEATVEETQSTVENEVKTETVQPTHEVPAMESDKSEPESIDSAGEETPAEEPAIVE